MFTTHEDIRWNDHLAIRENRKKREKKDGRNYRWPLAIRPRRFITLFN